MVVSRAIVHHSFANLDDVQFSHLDWHYTLDFEHKTLQGSVEYDIKLLQEVPEPVVVLDARYLRIQNAYVDGKKVAFELSAEDATFGQAVVVPVTTDATKVKVEYATTTESIGAQWLDKALTAGKKYPYLFTQCQAIHARTVLPCPDTPGCKFTYSATAHVPEWCTVVMSAISTESPRVEKGTKTASFRQDVPIPSYLLAIAAGEMESRQIGPRSRVWAEPSVVGKAAYEFAETEDFIQHAEAIMAQEYVWKRYDLVCLPPSFPYGGMENPCLTFVTPTLLAGDRSLADVVAHEIAHSWTGNLVTNHTWKDFWLNEGWTVWLERKIQARIHNDPSMYDLTATLGLRDLKESVAQFGETHKFTALVPPTDDVDPDESFSSVPYEKGFAFLNYLTQVVGGRTAFETFARAYIQKFKYGTLTAEQFKEFFVHYFTHEQPKVAAIAAIEWDKWFYTPGMPLVMAPLDTSRTSEVTALAECIAQSNDPTVWRAATSTPLSKWPTQLWLLLLDTLLMQQSDKNIAFSKTHLDALDAFTNHQLSTSKNSEIRFRWYTLTLRAKDARNNDLIAAFLGEQGRMKFVRPLFRDLIKFSSKQHAERVFATTGSLYHPICARLVQRDLDAAKHTTTAKKTVVTTYTTTTTSGPGGTKSTTTTTTTTSASGVARTGWKAKVSRSLTPVVIGTVGVAVVAGVVAAVMVRRRR